MLKFITNNYCQYDNGTKIEIDGVEYTIPENLLNVTESLVAANEEAIIIDKKFMTVNSDYELADDGYLFKSVNYMEYLFIELKLKNISNFSKVKELFLNFKYNHSTLTCVDIYKMNVSDIENSSLEGLSIENGLENGEYYTTIEMKDDFNEIYNASIDLSNLLSDYQNDDKIVIAFVIKDQYSSFNIYGEPIGEDIRIYFSTNAVIKEETGMEITDNYEDFSVGNVTSYVALNNGSLYTQAEILTTFSKRMPINLTMLFNKNDSSIFTNPNNLLTNFHYEIEKVIYRDSMGENLYRGKFILTDPTGYKKEYLMISKNSLPAYRQIKESALSNLPDDIYICLIDNSYLYEDHFTTNIPVKIVDKNNNMLILYNNHLMGIRDSFNNQIDLTWNNDLLTRIQNNDGEILLFEYGEDYVKVDFKYDDGDEITNIKYSFIEYLSSYINISCLSNVGSVNTSFGNYNISFENNIITSIKNLETNNLISFSYDNNKISKVISYVNNSVIDEVNYEYYDSCCMKYSYYDKSKTRSSVLTKYYYYFDKLGNIVSIVNNNGEIIDYSYINIENQSLKKINTISSFKINDNKVENLLDNASWSLKKINYSITNIDDLYFDQTNEKDEKMGYLEDIVFKIPKCNAIIDDEGYTYNELSCELTENGMVGDVLSLYAVAKGLSTNNNLFDLVLTITYLDNTTETFYTEFTKNYNEWQAAAFNIKACKSYKKLSVKLRYNGLTDAYFDSITLTKGNTSCSYQYNTFGQVIGKSVNGEAILNKVYDEHGRLIKEFNINGTCAFYEYNNLDQVILKTDEMGNKTAYEYNDKHYLLKETLTTYNDEVFYKQYSYDELGNVTLCINDKNEKVTYIYDMLSRLIEERYEVSNDEDIYEVIKSKFYTYNEKSLLSTISDGKNVEVCGTNKIYYNSNLAVNRLQNSKNENYYYSLDNANRATNVYKTNNTNSYVIYNYLDTGYKNYISKKQMGIYNKDYEYSNNYKLLRVLEDNDVIVDYQYDGDLVEVINDYNTNEKTNIKYDENDRINQKIVLDRTSNIEKNRYDYYYDDNDSLQKVNYNNEFSVEYDYNNERNITSRNAFTSLLTKKFDCDLIDSDHYAISLYGANNYGTKNLQVINDTSLNLDVINVNDPESYLHYYMSGFNGNKKISANGSKFSLDKWKDTFKSNKCFLSYMSFDNVTNEITLFTFKNKVETIGVQAETSTLLIDTDGKLTYKNKDGIVIKTNGAVTANKYCLIGIIFRKVNDDYKVRIVLNNEITNEVTISTNITTINSVYIFNDVNNTNIVKKLASVLVSAYSFTNEDLLEIYNIGNNSYTVLENATTKTLFYDTDVYNDFDVVTLNGNFVSTKSLKPERLNGLDGLYENISDSLFTFNEEKNHYVYKSFDNTRSSGIGSMLGYNLPLTNKGTLVVKFLISDDTITRRRVILSSCINQTSSLSIFIENNKIKCEIPYVTVNVKDFTVKKDVWYTLVFSYNNSSNNVTSCTLQVRSNDNNLSNPFMLTTNLSLENHTTFLGCNEYASNLNGYMSMFAYSTNAYLTVSKALTFLNKGDLITVSKTYDSLGRLVSNKIKTSTNLLEGYNVYDRNKVTTQILSNGTRIEYTYTNDKLISKELFDRNNDSVFKNEFEYDDFGRLIKEVRVDGVIVEYGYDINGNITYKKVNGSLYHNLSRQYTYDNLDNLINITYYEDEKDLTTVLTYDTNYKYHMTNIVSSNNESIAVEWNGNKLTKYDNVAFEYNYQNLRTKKESDSNISEYIYDGNKIIGLKVYDKVNNENLVYKFIYDESNQVIGLIINKNNYYYERDITGNINRILDNSGNVMVEYKYDAWGLVLDTVINEPLLRYNPFLYKGYVYDVETSLFWLSSRYYSPELCRFISPDDVEYLDPESVNGLNLYCYCLNNPVMYSDGSGHMPEWLGNLLTGIGIVVGTALFVAAIVASAGTVGALVGVGAAAIGLSTTAVSTAITVATISTYVVAGGVALFGASDAVEAFSGGINPIRDYVMGGNQTAYNITSGIFNTFGTVACIAGMVGPKILQKIAQRGGVPKISNGKTVGYSMDFFDKKNNWSFRIDATTHGNPKYHHNPHIHYIERDVKQGGISKAVKYFWEIIKGWF